eukprot:365813-Chlamydomonas_euryale.AAC.9
MRGVGVCGCHAVGRGACIPCGWLGSCGYYAEQIVFVNTFMKCGRVASIWDGLVLPAAVVIRGRAFARRPDVSDAEHGDAVGCDPTR